MQIYRNWGEGGGGVNFLVNIRQGPEFPSRRDLNLRWDYCAPTAGYFVQSEVDFRRKPTEHRVGTAGRKTVRDWQGGPDELDERFGLFATAKCAVIISRSTARIGVIDNLAPFRNVRMKRVHR